MMRLHDCRADRKAEAKPVALGGCERLKQPLRHASVRCRRRLSGTRQFQPAADCPAGRPPRGDAPLESLRPDVAMASIKLCTRLRTTCCNCTRSACTGGRSDATSTSIRIGTPDASVETRVTTSSISVLMGVDRADMRLAAAQELAHAFHDARGVVNMGDHGGRDCRPRGYGWRCRPCRRYLKREPGQARVRP